MAEKIMHHLQKKKKKQSKAILNNMWLDFDVRRQQGMNLYTGGNIIMDYEQKGWFKLKMMDSFIYLWNTVMFLSAVWTLTAHIQCKGSIGEQVM